MNIVINLEGTFLSVAEQQLALTRLGENIPFGYTGNISDKEGDDYGCEQQENEDIYLGNIESEEDYEQ